MHYNSCAIFIRRTIWQKNKKNKYCTQPEAIHSNHMGKAF